MLTNRTQKAIEIIHEIAYHQSHLCQEREATGICAPECARLLEQLCTAGIIRLLPDRSPGRCISYELCHNLTEVTLYQLLVAIGENINLLVPAIDEERIYLHYRYGIGAARLGVVNQTLRTLLSDIYMTDF